MSKLIEIFENNHFRIEPILISNYTIRYLRSSKSCIELGTGWGPAMLMLAHNMPQTGFLGVDIRSGEIKRGNKYKKLLKLNNLRFRKEDIRKDSDCFKTGCYDLVLFNPPFHPLGSGRLPEDEDKRIADFEYCVKLEDFFNLGKKLIKPEGSILMIYPSQHRDTLVEMIREKDLYLTRFQDYKHDSQTPPALTLFEIKKQYKVMQRIPAMIYNSEEYNLMLTQLFKTKQGVTEI